MMSGTTKREKDYTRIKEQKIVQYDSTECEITRSDCEEFIRVVKRFGTSFTEKDLAQYCRLNHIPISEHTIECMFEEFFLNKKNERDTREITADDLISLTSKKTNRCFYVPVVVYIGKRSHIRSYEEGLKKAKEKEKKNEQIEKDNLKKQIQRDKKNKQRNEKMNYVWEDEIWGRSNFCTEATSIDREGKVQVDSTNVKTRDGEAPNAVQHLLEANRANSEENDEQLESSKQVEVTEKGKGNHDDQNTNSSGTMKKSSPGRKGKSGMGRKGAAAQHEKEQPTAAEAKRLALEEQKREKQIYYDSLMQQVLNNIQKGKEKKKKHLTTFNFVTYYKLHELIYMSFLVDKYQGYFQGTEESDLIDIYTEEGEQMDRSEDSRGDGPGETTMNSGEENVQAKMEEEVEGANRITLEQVVHKYKGDREKEEEKKKKLKKKTHKYIHSNQLANFQFVKKNIEEIMNSVLYNLNTFFNDKVLEVERVMEEYSTVVAKSNQGNACTTQVVMCIDADKEKNELLNKDKTFSSQLIEGNEKASLLGEALALNEGEEATGINTPQCDSLPQLKNKKKCVSNGEVITSNQPSETVGQMKKEITKGGEKPNFAEGHISGQEGEAEGGNKNIKRGCKGRRAKRMHTFKRPPGTHLSEMDEAVDGPSDVQLNDEETLSDHYISYANLKYTEEEIKQKNFIYYLTHDINKIETFKRKYFYDFFFMYMVRKLFWNVLCLYYLHWNERLAQDTPMQSGSPDDPSLSQPLRSHLTSQINSQGLDEDNLILYESDVSVNNAKKNKTMLYNTNQKLCHNLDPLFKLIRSEKLLIYLRYDQNKRVKCKNKTEYLYREIWQYLIFTNLKQKEQTGTYSPFSEFVLFRQD
ncbi:hypothetical protein AK88_00499 [Plasmodium fragile]|uniref:Uncharacterized protein n=1 Tax=Plasmodium fragile TaxID=5857 RepID=A0A0D9QU50_PLAFR|nr:uncharacterized protein AK88_00499 [Plasmodium fragile]KJP89791.1 hypothetical protein AK88_00499 [Plasmodium fragile]